MGRKKGKQAKRRKGAAKARKVAASLARLEHRLDELTEEHRVLRKRLKRLERFARAARRRDVLVGFGPGPGAPPGASPAAPPGAPPWGPPGRPGPGGGPFGPGGRGRPPWAKGPGPVVSIEVPLETDDPGAPLWATVAARLPDEVTTVGDDGRIVRYRYSPVGSTPQAPRYRRLFDPPPGL